MKSSTYVIFSLFYFFCFVSAAEIVGRFKLCKPLKKDDCKVAQKLEFPEEVDVCTRDYPFKHDGQPGFLSNNGAFLARSERVACSSIQRNFNFMFGGNSVNINQTDKKFSFRFIKENGEIISSFSLDSTFFEDFLSLLKNPAFQIMLGCFFAFLIVLIIFIWLAIKYNFLTSMKKISILLYTKLFAKKFVSSSAPPLSDITIVEQVEQHTVKAIESNFQQAYVSSSLYPIIEVNEHLQPLQGQSEIITTPANTPSYELTGSILVTCTNQNCKNPTNSGKGWKRLPSHLPSCLANNPPPTSLQIV
jgi:hypothetical protein